ncbi:hypothetical protein V1285_004531 [Bradyrhizobium sp. AZCC 1620]
MPVLLRYWTQLSGLIAPNRFCSSLVDGKPIEPETSSVK